MSEEYEDLDVNEEELDRGDLYDGDQDEDIEELEETDDDESDDSEVSEDIEEEEEEPEIPKKEIKIPKSRFDEVIRQREEAKERNLWLESQLEKLIEQSAKKAAEPEITLPSYDFDEAEERYISLIIEGETSQASKLRAEIDKQRQAELRVLIASITESATSKAKSESAEVIEQERFSTLIESYENKYKFLNTNAKEYNEEAVDTINTLLAGYVASGKTKVEGLKLAVAKVAPLYTSPVQSKPTLGNQRKVEAGKKAAKAANSQPTKTKSVSTRSVDSETIAVAKMSDRDFSKLTEKEKRILRGD